MKKIFLLLLLLSSLTFSKNSSDIKMIDNIAYQNGKLYSGETVLGVVDYSDGKNYRMDCIYLNGKLNGKYTIYYDNNLIKEIGNYKDNLPNGDIIRYFKNGKTSDKIKMSSGKPNGILYNYYETGILKETSTYVNGLRNGEYNLYYENGKLKLKGTDKNDKQQGLAYRYDEKGKLISIETWDKGNLIKEEKK